MFENKSKNKLLGIENICNILNRTDKKKILNKYIKSIEITIDDKYNIAIKNVIFNNEFINYGISNLMDIALNCIKESNENLTIHKPIIDTKITDDYTLSLLEEFEDNKNNFQQFWQNIIKENSTLYPIYDLSNVLTDIKVKVIPV